MRRVVSLYLPTWPTDRLRRQADDTPPPDKPLVIAGRDGSRRVLLAADGAAQHLGLGPGLTIARARAYVPDLVVVDADPVADTASLERLAAWALRYSPIAAPDAPDGLWIDITGAAHLFGGEDALLADLVGRLADAGIDARAAAAETAGAAHALARFGRPALINVPTGGLAAALHTLPVAALRLPSEFVNGLHRLGFETIGDLERTPRAPLNLRFGPELGRRLDQAFGRRPEPIQPIAPPAIVRARRAFAEPIGSPAALERAIADLAGDLCAELEARGLGARTLDLLFHRVDNTVQAIRIGTAKPARDPRRLARLLADRLESVDPGFGVEIMTLAATLAEPLAPAQATTLDRGAAAADMTALVDVLANRIGHERLFRAVPVESDVPERSVRFVEALAPATGANWPENWPRPGRLLSPPEPIDTTALLPDHPPVVFTWRGVRRRVIRADGPERIFGEWWRRDREVSAVRDYFQVEDEAGERFWLFRSGDGVDPTTGPMRWFIHGVFG